MTDYIFFLILITQKILNATISKYLTIRLQVSQIKYIHAFQKVIIEWDLA